MLRDSFSFRQFMISHSLNIKFSSSSSKRSNCLSRRCSFAFTSRTSLRTRNRFLCTLRMRQVFLVATHAKHFSDASPKRHCLVVKEQDLQSRMLMNNISKLKTRNCFRWEDVRLLSFAKGIFHTFVTS